MRLSSTLILLLCSLCSTLGCGEDDGPTRPPAPEAPTNTIFVDTAAPPEGTGAESAPLRTISEALSVEGVTKIVVATGTYEVPAQHSFATALSIESLAGKSETFFINRMASAPLSWSSSESLTVSGVTFFIGLNLSGESFTFNDIAIDTGGAALEASGLETLIIDGAAVTQGEGVELQDVTAAQIAGLTLDGTQRGLIALDTTLSLTASTITGVVGPAIGLENTAATLRQVDISDVTQADDLGGDGIHLKGGSLDYEGGEITNVADRGVALTAGAQGSLSGLTLRGGIRAMVYVVEGSSATATDLTVSDSNICVFASAGTLELSRSQVGPCASMGLLSGTESTVDLVDSVFEQCPMGTVTYLQDSGGRVEGCTLRSSSDSGCLSVSDSSAGMLIADNEMSDCRGTGVSLLRATDVEIRGNTISDILAAEPFPDVAHAISLIDSDSIDITSNQIDGVERAGVSMLRSSARIQSNSISSTGAPGVSLVDPGEEPSVIDQNIIEASVGAGIAIFSAEADITSNTISGTLLNTADNLGDGIIFAVGAKVNVSDNTVENSANNGIIFIEEASGTISGNTLRGNNLFGIFEFCGAPNDVLVEENTFEDNGRGDVSICE